MMKITKRKILNVLLPVFMFAMAFIIGTKTDVKAGTWDNAADYYNTYGDRCIFSVVNGEPRVYFGSAGTKAVANHTRYRTIGWKVSLYQNGSYQESVYCSLNGSYIRKFPSSNSNGTEYNLYYIDFNRLKSRFSNQAAINSGAGTLYFDAVMSIVPANSNTPNGTINDWGNTTGEVYDTFEGISKARGWGHPDDLRHYYNKSPEGLYRNVYVYKGTGISSVSGGGTYVYGAWATISATCSTGYDFNYWSNSSSSSSSFGVKVTSDLSYTAYGKPQTYTISYNANGGTGAPGNQIKTYGYVLTLSSQKPTKTGYIFNYWDGSDGGTYYPGSSFGTDADTVLTAHWTPITYYVSYNKNKPDKASHDVSGIMTNSTHSYNNEIKSAGYTPNLSKNGYSIKGWSFRYWDSQANDKGTDYSNGSYIKNLTSTNGATINMYAQWKPNVYMLILDDQYATSDGTPYIYEKYDYGWYSNKTYGKDFAGDYADGSGSISNVIVPKKTGMKFNGYYTEKYGKGTKYIDENGNIVAKNNAFDDEGKYVYAYWTPNIYDITLDNQGATKSGTTHVYEKYSVGFFSDSKAANTFPNGKIDIPQKDNYIFDGYWTEQNNYKTFHGEEIINADGTINNVNTKFAANSTIFAKWVPKDYKIKLDNQGADIDKGTAAFYEKYNEYNYTSLADYDVSTGIATMRFDYTGNTQYFIAPADGEYTLTVAGAQGGDHNITPKEPAKGCGGDGGTSTGKIKLKKGETLAIEVGNKPSGYNGSYNGSDSGWLGVAANGIYVEGSLVAGGGATDIRKGGNGIDNRVIVAGGGGGATYYVGKAVDGAAGGGTETGTVKYITGISNDYGNIYTTVNKGANQTGHFNFTQYERHSSNLGGGCLSNPYSGTSYGFLYYLTADAQNKGFYGGGGGYWGGAFMHGNCVMAGGLGGSGYIGGVTDGSMTNGGNKGNGWATISYNAKELGQYSVVEKYFNYTGSVQTFTAPVDGEYLLEVGGAQGGAADYAKELGLSGGKGGVSTGKITLKKGEVLNIYVGQEGAPTRDAFNGGRYGQATFTAGENGKFDRDKRTDGGGGGATDIRKGGTDLSNRIIVAGGGGGATTYGYHGVNGGDGGGTTAGELKWVAWTGGAWDSKGVPHTIIGNSKLSPAGQTFSTDPDVAQKATLQPPTTDKTYEKNTPYAGSLGQGGYSSGGGYYGGTRYRGVASATSTDIGKSENPSGYRALYAQYSGGGGSGYIGGVTNGSMTTGINKGNGWAKITYTDTTLDGSSVCSIRTPQKTGYTFGGYYTQPNGQGDLVVNEDGMVTTTPTYFHEENRNGTEKANVNSKGETTVYAKWTNNQYSFHYIGNGGKTSTGGETISDGVSYNTHYHVRAANNTFYRTGYKLTGWREKNTDGTWGREWPADTNVTYLETHSTTVFAQWEALDVNYTINYYKEDLDGNYQYVTKEMRSAKTDSVEKVIPTTNKTLFDSTGFTLNKDKSCTGSNQIPESVDDGIISVKIKGDGSTVVNYYYSRNSYKLTLKIANGDKGFRKLIGAGDTNINNTWTQDKIYGQEVAIGAELNNDYEFVDWEYENKTVASKEASYKFTMPCNDVTLYACSNSKPGPDPNPKVSYTVTVKHYFQDGETSYKEDISKRVTDTIEENTLYTPKTTMIPSGYSYSKMVDSATGENAANGFIVTKNTTVDVYYDRLQYKIVTERYVDGVLYDTFAENAYYNEQYTVKGLDLKKCNLTGYKLDKIAVPGFGNVNSFTVTGNIPKENPIKVYYIPRTFTVTFNANSGNITDNNKSVTTAQRTVKYNHEDNNNVSSLNPVKTGYTFIGWYEKVKNEDGSDGEIQVYNAQGNCSNNGIHWKDSKWIKESNVTVYAHWKANNYTLTLDANGGYLDGGALEDGKANTVATLSPTYDKTTFNDVGNLNPQRTGYTFEGWYTTKNNGTQIYDKTGKCRNDGTYWKDNKWHYAGNAILYAHWTPNTYTVSYDANSGTGTMKSDTATYDSPYTTRNNEGFKKTGYTFNGWNTKTDGTGEDWTGRIGKPFNWNYAHDVKLYAQWKPNEYVIVFDKNKPDPENKAQNNKYVLASNDVKGTMNNQPMTYDKNKNLDENKYKLTGWTFTGWNTKADGSGTPYENKASIKNLTSENNATVILYAQWRQNTYTVEYHAKYPTGVNHDSKINGTMPTTDFKYDDPKKALEKNKYTLEGWTFNGWDEYEPKKTSYDDEELVSNLTEKDKGKVIIYTRWKDDTAPDKNETYLQVTDRNGQTVYSDKAYAKDRNKGTLYTYKNDVSVKNVSPWTDSWDTQWLNNPVYINLYSHDKGSGIDRLTVYNLTENGSKYYERTSFTNIYDNVSTIETNNKAFSTNKATKFNGTAADKSGNKTTTRAITVKIDTKAPTGNFIVKTGTLKNPLAGTTSMIYDSNGMVTGVNPEGMRTEITATISDNGNENSVSGVKHVWAVVTDMENVNISKSYKCNRISGDKYNGTYIAVDESGNKPNLYEDFSTSRKLKIKVYACDEAGNISVYKDKEPSNDPNKPTSVTPPSSDPENNIVTNISMWSQIIRDDKEVPDTSYAIGKDGKDKDGHSAEGPAFLLNQSGKVHIVTYGYVEAVDVNFPPALQAAAQTDVAKGQTVKNLGTIANVDGAYVDNRLALSGDCARITDYPFIVPLYLDDTSVKAYETNGDKWLDGITNGIKIPAYIPTANTYMPKKADGTYDIKTVDTVEIPYKGNRTVSGTVVPIEPYNKNECDLRTTASFYCAKDYASKQIISITDKLHTHLVN